eukprot:gnl/MRDRNA2_/MRDRNA2_86186_c1_seq4.p1 gnl/MRDRNA2_/MRDRNA2_86186_c1~~gnl/MRDRNA2_/MRDRNA2_86186_c1_seq4.p1  ORF type:complete len:116 (-),score=10.39 gnl/MRDRNA2_/MRDRNA2_86186_c1_seq4:148-495(-)
MLCWTTAGHRRCPQAALLPTTTLHTMCPSTFPWCNVLLNALWWQVALQEYFHSSVFPLCAAPATPAPLHFGGANNFGMPLTVGQVSSNMLINGCDQIGSYVQSVCTAIIESYAPL